MEELQSAKLTKKFFTSLKSGLFLMSNVAATKSSSKFAEYVAATLPEKEKQWKKIVALDCNNRLCHIFKNEAQAKNWIAEVF